MAGIGEGIGEGTAGDIAAGIAARRRGTAGDTAEEPRAGALLPPLPAAPRPPQVPLEAVHPHQGENLQKLPGVKVLCGANQSYKWYRGQARPG